jgi:hypothetical protein
VYELAVVQIVLADCCVQAGYPQGAVIAFFVAAVNVSILAGVGCCIYGKAQIAFAATIVALCGFHYFFAALAARNDTPIIL